ncbi:hypothetical protein AB0K51_08415 [Kitasatospora sp. NPDC049285]|uniref:acyltransferase family protein n=1 Tax=Kitasatospora sp. NPDC049285 TaxID=3157096 RepID=UPI003428D97C
MDGRRALFDHAKFAAVALVVCAHTWMPLLDDRVTVGAVLTVAAFAMPLFTTLCGYFARPRPGRPAVDGPRLVTQLAVPYLVFQVLYQLAGFSLPVHLLEPRWLTWFLLSLLLWRLSVPLWTALRRPLPVAVLVAAASGTATALPAQFALGRTLGFLPFFVLGLTLRPEHFALLRTRPARRLAPLVLALVAAGFWLAAPRLLDPGWIEYTDSAAQLHTRYLPWLAVRAALGAVALLAGAAFLALLPDRPTRWTRLGAASLYVYLLHGLVLKVLQHAGLYRRPELHHWYVALPLLGAFALALAVVLALPASVRLLRPLVQPPVGRLLAPRAPAQRPSLDDLSGHVGATGVDAASGKSVAPAQQA